MVQYQQFWIGHTKNFNLCLSYKHYGVDIVGLQDVTCWYSLFSVCNFPTTKK